MYTYIHIYETNNWTNDFSALLTVIESMSCYSASPAWIINGVNLMYWLSFLQIQYFPKGYSGQNRRRCIASDMGTTPINYLLAAHRQLSLFSWMTVYWFMVQKIPGTVLDCIMFNKDGPARSVNRSQNCQWGLQHSCQNKLSLQSSCWNSQKGKSCEKKVVSLFCLIQKIQLDVLTSWSVWNADCFCFSKLKPDNDIFLKRNLSRRGRYEFLKFFYF